MSTTESQNGAATGAQSNGIKTASSSSASTPSSTSASSGISPSGGGRGVGLTNSTSSGNASFLYSSSSAMLSREKLPRQVPPPTLPKYTSSFNAGSNGGGGGGGGGGAGERIGRDREAGGSYRLASLDRLALRQRILDGEKANGEPISVRDPHSGMMSHLAIANALDSGCCTRTCSREAEEAFCCRPRVHVVIGEFCFSDLRCLIAIRRFAIGLSGVNEPYVWNERTRVQLLCTMCGVQCIVIGTQNILSRDVNLLYLLL
jgi:hypothetical protein